MAIAFIAGAMVGGLIGAALVYSYELQVLRGFRKRVEQIEQDYLAMLKAEEKDNEHDEN